MCKNYVKKKSSIKTKVIQKSDQNFLLQSNCITTKNNDNNGIRIKTRFECGQDNEKMLWYLARGGFNEMGEQMVETE